MFDGDAFGIDGAGCVENVGEVLGRGAGSGILDRGVGQLFVGVEAHADRVVRGDGGGAGQGVVQGGLGENGVDLCVAQEKRQSLGGVDGVERDVGGAGLEHAEKGGDHVGGAFEVHADQGFGADAEGEQAMGDAVGAFVEFAVGDPLVAVDHGLGGGGSRCLKFEPIVESTGAQGRGVGRRGFGVRG